MSKGEWLTIAGVVGLLLLVGTINERLAYGVGATILAVLIIRNPDKVLHPFG